MEDTYFDSPTPEEQEEERRQKELARQIRDEVRRIETGEADEDIADDQRQRDAEEEARLEHEERIRKRKESWLWQLATGDVLVRNGAARYYRFLGLVAVAFFASIIILFSTLHMEKRCTELEQEVELLHERSIRLEQQRYRRCSHEAIMQALQQRGINLYDPLTSARQAAQSETESAAEQSASVQQTPVQQASATQNQ